MVERRNHEGYWAGRVRWLRLARRQPPPCDDCVVLAYESGQAVPARLDRARWRRTVDDSDRETFLCEAHKRAWEQWTPGQMELM
jgi:hypothetical protein